MKIPGNGLHYREAGRLWLRSEDNGSVGRTMLLTLYSSSSSFLHIPMWKAFSPTMLKVHRSCVLNTVWGGSMGQVSNTFSPLADPRLWRLAGENLHHPAASGIFLLRCNHPLLLSPPHTETWMLRCLCVLISCLSTKHFSFSVLYFFFFFFKDLLPLLKLKLRFMINSF